MKTAIASLGICLLVVLTGFDASYAQVSAEQTQLEIYYTHSTNRCPGCSAIETQALETLNNTFKNELETGKIKFKAVNIDDAANKDFVEKYKVWGSSLFIVNNGNNKTIDLTRDGFAFARSRPEMFRDKLEQAIRANMN